MAVESIDLVAAATGRRSASLQPISPTEPTVTAFLGRTERGPVNEPVRLSSFDDYRRAFGGHCAFSHLSHAVQHYFQNGGESAVVVRLINGATRSAIGIPAGDQALRLQARRPGSREFLRVSVDYDRVENDPERFNLVVQRLHRPGSQLIEDQELFPAVSISGTDRRFIVDALQESELVTVAGPLPTRRPDATRAKHPGQAIPYVDLARTGTDGDELTDYDVVGSNEEGIGLFALDRVERIDLLCIPPAPSRDVGTTAFLAASRYCERRRAMLIWDPPWSWQSSESALRGIRAAGLVSANALTYFPRVRPRAEFARFPAGLPASGALAGMLSRGDSERLAGRAGQPGHALRASLTTAADIGQKQASMLKRFGVNALVRMQGGHVVLQGNACLAPQDTVPGASQRLDARRATLLVLAALERGTRWVPAEAHLEDTCGRLERHVREFLLRLHDLGVLAGQRPEQSFFVRVAPRSGEPEAELMLRVGFALLRPGQFLIYEIRFRRDGAVTRAVPPLESC